jgi:hypothetical protein
MVFVTSHKMFAIKELISGTWKESVAPKAPFQRPIPFSMLKQKAHFEPSFNTFPPSSHDDFNARV